MRVTWLHLSLSIRRPVCVYVRMYARMYVCMCVCMYVYLASHAPQHPSASGRILPTATQLVPRPPLEARVRCSTAPCPGHVCVCVCVYKFIYIYMTVRPPSRYTYMRYICTYTHTTQLGAARQHLVLALARCHQGMPHNRRRVINRRSMLGKEASCIAHHASRTHPHHHLQRGGSVAELLDAGRQGRDFAPHRVDFALQVLLQRLGGVAICGAASRITHHSLITPHPHHHRITPSSPSSPAICGARQRLANAALKQRPATLKRAFGRQRRRVLRSQLVQLAPQRLQCRQRHLRGRGPRSTFRLWRAQNRCGPHASEHAPA